MIYRKDFTNIILSQYVDVTFNVDKIFKIITVLITRFSGVIKTISFDPKLRIMKFVFILFLASVFAVGIWGTPIHDDYGRN